MARFLRIFLRGVVYATMRSCHYGYQSNRKVLEVREARSDQ
jgi:hypothetical protein